MKSTTLSLAFCFSLFIGFAQAADYYIYQDRDGKLVISNQKPPPGSKIIMQQTLPEDSDNETQTAQEKVGVDPQLSGNSEASPNPSRNK